MFHLRASLVLLGCLSLIACAVSTQGDDDPASSDGALSDPSADAGGADAGQDISIGQHTALTVDRGAPQTYRVVAYGDSIFAGYHGSIFGVARRSAPYVAGEYLAAAWGSNVEVIRRTRSGAFAQEVYERTIVADRSYMTKESTRAVFFEMCGNDYLDARKKFAGQSGRCDLSRLETTLATCATHMGKAMEAINDAAVTAEHKAIANLYYPGFDADGVAARCTEADGHHPTIQDALLPFMARSNWQACTLAKQHGFACVDAFAELMGADVDTNGDGVVDSDGLRFDPNESEADYVTRVTVTLRSTVRDANHHGLGDATEADYLQDDDIHPTYYLDTVYSGTTKRFPADFSDAELTSGKTSRWNRLGHERLGWALWNARPSTSVAQ